MENDIKIGNVDSYDSGKDEAYSHQALIMQAKKRVLELGQHELAEGINETTYDERTGTTKIVYKEDTRKAFIQSIKITQKLMECDYDKKAIKVMKELNNRKEKKRKELLKLQEEEWNKSKLRVRRNFPHFNKDYLHKELPFYSENIEYEIETYLDIFSELNKLAKRKDFYKAEIFEG